MSEKKKKGKQELAKAKEAPSQALTLEQVMAHPAVQQINQKLEEARQMLANLPEAIGRAVAEAQRAGRIAPLPIVSGPAVQLRGSNTNVEFHRKGRIVQDGKEIAPEGPTQGDFVKDLGELRRKSGAPPLPALLPPPSEKPPVDPPAGEASGT